MNRRGFFGATLGAIAGAVARPFLPKAASLVTWTPELLEDARTFTELSLLEERGARVIFEGGRRAGKSALMFDQATRAARAGQNVAFMRDQQWLLWDPKREVWYERGVQL